MDYSIRYFICQYYVDICCLLICWSVDLNPESRSTDPPWSLMVVRNPYPGATVTNSAVTRSATLQPQSMMWTQFQAQKIQGIFRHFAWSDLDHEISCIFRQNLNLLELIGCLFWRTPIMKWKSAHAVSWKNINARWMVSTSYTRVKSSMWNANSRRRTEGLIWTFSGTENATCVRAVWCCLKIYFHGNHGLILEGACEQRFTLFLLSSAWIWHFLSTHVSSFKNKKNCNWDPIILQLHNMITHPVNIIMWVLFILHNFGMC